MSITLPYPKPKMKNDGFGCFLGHPEVTVESDLRYFWADVTYSDGATEHLWFSRTSRPGVYVVG